MMSIGLKILFIVGIIILVIAVLLIFLLVVPFRYIINLSYGDDEISFDFKYSVITFNAFVAFKSNVKYYLKILGMTIFDSDSKKKENGKDKNVQKKFVDTEFMRDKSINEEMRASNEDAHELLKSAKKFEKKQLEDVIKSGAIEKDEYKSKVDSFIDRLHNIIPSDMKYVLKKVSDEVFKLLKKLAPADVDIDVSYGSNDPYMVGLSYAIFAPLISITGSDISATPKFGSDEISVYIELVRRVPLITIVIPVVRLLIDKRFRNIVFSKR